VGKDNARFIRGTQNLQNVAGYRTLRQATYSRRSAMMIRGVRLTKNDIDQFICDDEWQFSEAVYLDVQRCGC
jgi:hypothetical protein